MKRSSPRLRNGCDVGDTVQPCEARRRSLLALLGGAGAASALAGRARATIPPVSETAGHEPSEPDVPSEHALAYYRTARL